MTARIVIMGTLAEGGPALAQIIRDALTAHGAQVEMIPTQQVGLSGLQAACRGKRIALEVQVRGEVRPAAGATLADPQDPYMGASTYDPSNPQASTGPSAESFQAFGDNVQKG